MKDEKSQPHTPPLKQAVFDRIESEKMCPRSRYFFLGKEFAVWAFWVLSVIVGALAVAVTLFVVSHHQYALYEATHSNFLTFTIDVLPYLWIVIFIVMGYVSVYNLRHTKRGYRYSLNLVLLSSILFSLIGGLVLQAMGLGYEIDELLGQKMSLYTSQTKLERGMWQAPEQGRLVGKQVFSTESPTSTIIFEDVNGRRWRVEFDTLSPHDMNLLSSERMVRLIGIQKPGPTPIFYACGAFPWMFESNMTAEKMGEERKLFVEWLGLHMNQSPRQWRTQGSTTRAGGEENNTPCMNLVRP